ncbi:MAG: response regulator transcription factor [Clostridia bacterium]|nr:response regulator transcription factor [Clostridia bacterium]
MAYSVLLVEDSFQISEGIVDFFANKANGEYDITVVNDGDSALAIKDDFDLVFLDIMLPGASGFEVCSSIRRRSDCPIIFLTAMGTEETILKGYELGADDYIVKPFSLEQLFAKTQVMIKRANSGRQVNKRLVVDEIELDTIGMRLFVSGKEVTVTAKEYFLLKILMEHKGMILSREQLLERVWGYDYDGSERVVDTHIKKLRRLLGDKRNHIKTAIGRGYKIV